jgi:hypothetical protein
MASFILEVKDVATEDEKFGVAVRIKRRQFSYGISDVPLNDTIAQQVYFIIRMALAEAGIVLDDEMNEVSDAEFESLSDELTTKHN